MNESIVSPTINPWWRIWVQPRQTIRYLIDTDPKMHFWVLVVFYGIIRAVAMGMQAGLGDIFSPSQVATFILIGGPLSGVIGVFLTGSLLEVVSRIFGGRAEGQHIRTVLAWATIPMSVLVILGILPLLALFGSSVFASAEPQMQQFLHGRGFASEFLGGGLLTWRAGMEIIGSLYYLVITVVGLAEIQQFGIWKAAGTVFVVIGGLLLGLMCIATIGLAA
jgi:hypothetical protein